MSHSNNIHCRCCAKNPARVLLLLMYVLAFFVLSTFSSAQTTEGDEAAEPAPPQLNGAHFRITALQENGFLDMSDDDDNDVTSARSSISYSGYLIDMLQAVAKESRANFTYTLLPPSGYGSLCVPRLDITKSSDKESAYDPIYRTQYNCGASDVNDPIVQSSSSSQIPQTNDDESNNNNNNNNSTTTLSSVLTSVQNAARHDYSTDMYLGLYYVTPARQLVNQFTLPFLPPFSGTLAMFGTATGVPNFQALVEQQAAGVQPAACAPGGTALLDFVVNSYPGIQVQGIFGGEDDIYQAFLDGTCEVYIVDGPIAAQFVLRRHRQGQCTANGKPIGVIGEPMNFGLSLYAIGVRRDISSQVVDTMSYWMNILMSCNPLDPFGPCPDGNLATFFDGQGGTGEECGYVLFPPAPNNLSAGLIAVVVVASVVFVVLLYTFWHRYRINRQKRIYARRAKAAMALIQRERELNEFIAHEVRNPLASAIAALSFVSSKASDPTIIPAEKSRAEIKRDINVIDSSLHFVNELLRNMLDLHRSSGKSLKLHTTQTDILKDVFEPVASILFMRGAKVDVLTDCPKNLMIMTDRMRMKQIFLNLSSNSTKFVEQGFIRLRAEVVDGKVMMYVEDSGPGIPPEKRDQLFVKFQESLDVLNQGTGIGLCVCKNLSEFMGADLFLDETYDSGIEGFPGTRFTLRMNQAPLEIENGFGGTNDASVELNITRELPENVSVLFCDDDTVIRKMFSRTLRTVAPSWQIREASNGETALRIVKDEKFDLIFMDQYMASVEKQLLGTETVRLLRANGVDSIICGLSANDKEEEFLAAGADAFMMKPFPCKKDALKLELLRMLKAPEAHIDM